MYGQLFICALFQRFCLFDSHSEEVPQTCKSCGHIVFTMQGCMHCLYKSKQCIQLCVLCARQFTPVYTAHENLMQSGSELLENHAILFHNVQQCLAWSTQLLSSVVSPRTASQACIDEQA